MASPGIPSLPLPSDGDHDRGAAVIAVGAVFGSLGLILVSTRLWVRWHIIKKLGLDDLFIFLGLVSINYSTRTRNLSRPYLMYQVRYSSSQSSSCRSSKSVTAWGGINTT